LVDTSTGCAEVFLTAYVSNCTTTRFPNTSFSTQKLEVCFATDIRFLANAPPTRNVFWLRLRFAKNQFLEVFRRDHARSVIAVTGR